MTYKNLSIILFSALFLSGCSYKLVDSQKLDAIDTRLANIEENISSKISKELDLKLKQQNEKIQVLFEKSHIEQKKELKSLNDELSTLIKIKNIVKVQTIKQIVQAPKRAKKVAKTHKEKLVVGSLEKVRIYPSDLVMDARIDTGAETSSIDANDITEFERDGKKWVRFTLVDDKVKTPHIIERAVVRTVRIKKSSQDDGYEKRFVVMLKVTLGDKKELSEFTLTSRGHMKYPVLIGRNVLQDLIMVDVSEKFIAPLAVEKEEKYKK